MTLSTLAIGCAVSCFLQRSSMLVGVGASDISPSSCSSVLERLEGGDEGNGVFNEVSFVVHRNGDPDPCGMAPSSVEALEEALQTLEKCDGSELDKYQVESLLTQLLVDLLAPGSCGSTDDDEAPKGLLGYCDMGPDRTPLLMDHDKLLPVPYGSLPCRFFTREGLRISSLQQLKELALNSKKVVQEECESGEETCSAGDTVHLYAVPAGRVFMFAPKYVGEVFNLTHITGREGQPISIEVLNVEPRVFDIHNFFSREEAEELIQRALAETNEQNKLDRSLAGERTSIYRTGENAWDTRSKTALEIKRRSLLALGFDEYIEDHTDGLQILRYNTTKAYIEHLDFLDDEMMPNVNLQSAGNGANRFATILLYMSDLNESDGGETLFSEAWPNGGNETDRVTGISEAIRQLEESGDGRLLVPGSWQEEMAAKCRTHLAVRPRMARSVLFYSQLPNGVEDKSSKHGGCPVLNMDAQKWAANLWIWSAPRHRLDVNKIRQLAASNPRINLVEGGRRRKR